MALVARLYNQLILLFRILSGIVIVGVFVLIVTDVMMRLYTAKKRGKHPVNVELTFRVCDADEDCHVGRQKLRLELVVKG